MTNESMSACFRKGVNLTAILDVVVDIECSTSCDDVFFDNFDVEGPENEAPEYI